MVGQSFRPSAANLFLGPLFPAPSHIILTFLAGLILWRFLDSGDVIAGGITSTSATTIADDGAEWEIEKSLGHISNATLGAGAVRSQLHVERYAKHCRFQQFERVFAIGFEDRMNKRDAMTIGASLSGMKLEWIDGVRWKDINEKAYPAVCECLLTRLTS